MKERLTSRDLQARETRERLMRTAMDLIAGEGYRTVTVSRICRECGVSVGTFYQYFTSKKDIIVLLTREHNEYLSHACEADFSLSAGEIYLRYVDKYMHRIADSGLSLSKSLMLGLLESEVSDDEAGLQLQRDFFARLIAYGKETGEFSRQVEWEDFFEQFLITINGILTNWLVSQGAIDVIRYGKHHAGQLLRLLKNKD